MKWRLDSLSLWTLISYSAPTLVWFAVTCGFMVSWTIISRLNPSTALNWRICVQRMDHQEGLKFVLSQHCLKRQGSPQWPHGQEKVNHYIFDIKVYGLEYPSCSINPTGPWSPLSHSKFHGFKFLSYFCRKWNQHQRTESSILHTAYPRTICRLLDNPTESFELRRIQSTPRSSW